MMRFVFMLFVTSYIMVSRDLNSNEITYKSISNTKTQKTKIVMSFASSPINQNKLI